MTTQRKAVELFRWTGDAWSILSAALVLMRSEATTASLRDLRRCYFPAVVISLPLQGSDPAARSSVAVNARRLH